jgi:hypothetical protein
MEDRREPTVDEEAQRRSTAVIIHLKREVDERDETIRLLNEALSRALEELDQGMPPRAA